ncbi:hypothetical protein GCM10027271_10260 [Saccharopolyspora gloriosae]
MVVAKRSPELPAISWDEFRSASNQVPPVSGGPHPSDVAELRPPKAPHAATALPELAAPTAPAAFSPAAGLGRNRKDIDEDPRGT